MTMATSANAQALGAEKVGAARAASDAAVILARAEGERRRISGKYTQQRARTRDVVDDCKRVRCERGFLKGVKPDRVQETHDGEDPWDARAAASLGSRCGVQGDLHLAWSSSAGL